MNVERVHGGLGVATGFRAPAVEVAAARGVWSVARDAHELEAVRPAWQALGDRAALPAFAGPAWTMAFLDAFAPIGSGAEVHVLSEGARVLAVVPLVRERRCGVRRRRALENEHNPLWSLAIDPADPAAPRAARRVLERLLERTDELELRRLPLDGPVAALIEAAAQALGLRVERLPNTAGGDVTVAFAPWPEFQRRLSKNLRRDGRQRDKLAALGRVEVDVVESGPELHVALAEAFALEASGWKGAIGSPIDADPHTGRFYRRLAELSATAGQFALWRLSVGGRLVAYEYTLRSGGRMECLKIGYDEALSRYSPGTVLRLAMLEEVARAGLARTYHLGRPSEWKRRWADEVRPLGTLRIFGPSVRGRLCYLARTKLVRALRRKEG